MMSEDSVALPIFVAEGHDVCVFRDLASAEGKLEAVDVDAGVYDAWDAEGRVLHLNSMPSPHRLGAREVRITAGESRAADTGALRERLATVLATYGGRQMAGKPLPELVTAFVEWAGYSR